MRSQTQTDQVLSRRSFLVSGSAGSAAMLLAEPTARHAVASETASAAAGHDDTPLIDCHLHCFAGATDPRFPYHQAAPYRPTDAATPEQLLHCMDGAGVRQAIVVHPEPYQDDHRYLEHCLHVGGDRLKGTALVFADSDAAEAKLTELANRLPLIAARVHAYAPERLPPFGSPELRSLWRTATELGLAMQLHFEPRYAAGFEPLIREFAETPVIIDHLGRPFQGTPEEHRIVIRWADLPNTWLKVSSIPAKTSYPHRDIRPVIGELSRAYGAQRMLYGGGFNAQATPQSYRAAFDRAAELLGEFSAEEKAKVLGGNAARLFFG